MIEDVTIVHDFIRAFNGRDFERMKELAAPDCVIVALRSQLEGEFNGHEGLERWAKDYFEVVPDVKVTVDRIQIVGGNRALVLGVQAGSGGGGLPFETPLACVSWYDDESRLERMQIYTTRAEAIEAAGLAV